MAINLAVMALITFTPLNRELNLHYGNYLPAKLEELRQASKAPGVLFLGTSQTHNGFIPAVFDRELASVEGHGRQRNAPDDSSDGFRGNFRGDVTIRSFNMGLPNNRYDIMLGYLRMHQRKYGKPRLLLVELSPSIQEKDSATYYLPALYYRTLLEQEPSLAAVCLGNPLLSNNVRNELLLSSLSSFRQFRLTFSPLNLLGKVGEKLRFQPRFPGNPASAATTDNPTGQPRDPAESPHSFRMMSEWLARGWSPREKSQHMRTPEGIRQSVLEAEKYYIAPQKSVDFDKLEALLHYCRNQRIPVVLVTWPNHPAYRKVFEQSRLGFAYEQGLSRLLAREKTPVIDLNHLNSLSLNSLPSEGPGKKGRSGALSSVMPSARWEGFFSDPRHLTPEGAVFCSKQLARQLSGQ